MSIVHLRESELNGTLRINNVSIYKPSGNAHPANYFFPYTGTLLGSGNSKASSAGGHLIPVASLLARDTAFSVVGCGNQIGSRHAIMAGSANNISSTTGSFTFQYPSNAVQSSPLNAISLTGGSSVSGATSLRIVGHITASESSGTVTFTVSYKIISSNGSYPSKLYYILYTDDDYLGG